MVREPRGILRNALIILVEGLDIEGNQWNLINSKYNLYILLMA